jgi:hypothetical protein
MKGADASDLWLVEDSPDSPLPSAPPGVAAWYVPIKPDPAHPLFSWAQICYAMRRL